MPGRDHLGQPLQAGVLRCGPYRYASARLDCQLFVAGVQAAWSGQ